MAHAPAEAGAARVGVVAGRPAAAEEVMGLAGAAGSLACAADIAAADVVVNATSVGMGGTVGEGALPFGIDVDRVRPGQEVADLVYHPLRTPLLAAAEPPGHPGRWAGHARPPGGAGLRAVDRDRRSSRGHGGGGADLARLTGTDRHAPAHFDHEPARGGV